MSRIIKFRCWDTVPQRFHLIQEDQSTIGSLPYAWAKIARTPEQLIWQQFTGFYDKNGQEIYEGDILQNLNGDFFTVEFNQHRELFGFGDVNGFYLPDDCGEVVGNIFENPELLNE